MTKRWRELREAIDRIAHQLDLLDRRAEKMEVILMVREPSSGAAAEAYEGLRKQVVTAVTERLAHLSQLVQLDAALFAGSSTESVAKLVRGWLEQASLAQVSDPNHPDRDMLFEMLEDLGGDVQVLEPAYVDTATGRVIRRGSARRGQAGEIAGGPSHERGQSSASWEVGQ
jgi:hypothetical protein